MTNKMKLIFVIVATACATFLVFGTPFVVDIASRIFGAAAGASGPTETLELAAMMALVISGLYLAFGQRRHS